jgi:putative transcriptional regulator
MNEPKVSIAGKALVASPVLADPNFFRTVVYMIHHDAEGAAGVVVNRPTEKTVGSLLSDVASVCSGNTAPIYWGGPVDGPLTVLFRENNAGETIGVDSGPEKILALCTDSSDDADSRDAASGESSSGVGNAGDEDFSKPAYMLFDGYAGWGAGQLDDELQLGGWLVWDISASDVFGHNDEIWEKAVKEIGRSILSVGLGQGGMPDDPACN